MCVWCVRVCVCVGGGGVGAGGVAFKRKFTVFS